MFERISKLQIKNDSPNCYLLLVVLQPYSRCSCLELAGGPALLYYVLFLRRGDSGTHMKRKNAQKISAGISDMDQKHPIVSLISPEIFSSKITPGHVNGLSL